MKYLDRTWPEPAANLACEEVLLDRAAADGTECLRVWEAPRPFVVVGYANRIDREVHVSECRRRGIPILRRLSGGGTVVQGPGVLNYAVILRSDRRELGGIPETNRYVLDRVGQAVAAVLGRPVQRRGDTDLCLGEHKFSGNAQRRQRGALLFHGSLLLDPDLSLIEALLPPPSRSPAYRNGRSHRDFLRPLGVSPTPLKEALRSVWGARDPLEDVGEEAVQGLVASRYARAEWNTKF